MPFFLSLASGFRCRCFSYARQPVRFWWFLITFFAGFKDFCALRTQSSNEKRIHQRRLEHRKGFFCTTQWCDSQTHTHIQMHLDHWKLRPWNEGKAKLWDERERGKKQQQQCAALAAEKHRPNFDIAEEHKCSVNLYAISISILNENHCSTLEYITGVKENVQWVHREYTRRTRYRKPIPRHCVATCSKVGEIRKHIRTHTHTPATLYSDTDFGASLLWLFCVFFLSVQFIYWVRTTIAFNS